MDSGNELINQKLPLRAATELRKFVFAKIAIINERFKSQNLSQIASEAALK